MAPGLEERFGLDGKVAVVTGGGSGIGRAVCLALAEAGAAVAALDVDRKQAESVAAEIGAAGGKAVAAAGDVSDPAQIEHAIDRARSELGGLDILVNNAGIYPPAMFLDLPLEQWDRVLAVNLRGAFAASQIAGRTMAAAGNGGRIINLASVQAVRPTTPGLTHYSVTKAGMVTLTQAAALELAADKITVNAVAPGPILTPGIQAIMEGGMAGDVTERVPLGRWGTPEDVANVILFLASPAASYVTGSVFFVDGGFLLR